MVKYPYATFISLANKILLDEETLRNDRAKEDIAKQRDGSDKELEPNKEDVGDA